MEGWEGGREREEWREGEGGQIGERARSVCEGSSSHSHPSLHL